MERIVSEDGKTVTIEITFPVESPYKVKGVVHGFSWVKFLGDCETPEAAGTAVNAMSDIGRKNMVRDAAAGAEDAVAARATKAQNIQKGLLDLRGGGLEDVFKELRTLVIEAFGGKTGDYKTRDDMAQRIVGAIAGKIAGRKGVKASDAKALNKIMAAENVVKAASAELTRLEAKAQEIVATRADVTDINVDDLDVDLD